MLGTITGLIRSFASVAEADAVTKAALLTKGISEAMNCTAFGLIVAIPSMIFYRHYRSRVDGLVVEMEMQAVKLVEIVHGDRS